MRANAHGLSAETLAAARRRRAPGVPEEEGAASREDTFEAATTEKKALSLLSGSFDVILANPPYLPGPAGDEAALFGAGGGPLGDGVLLDVVSSAARLLAPPPASPGRGGDQYHSAEGGRLHVVANVANTATLGERVRRAWRAGGGGGARARFVHGQALTVAQYARVRERELARAGHATVLLADGVVDVNPHAFVVITTTAAATKNMTRRNNPLAARADGSCGHDGGMDDGGEFEFIDDDQGGALWDRLVGVGCTDPEVECRI